MTNERRDLDSQVEDEWVRFRGRLADRIIAMEVDDILSIDVLTGVDEEDLEGAAPYAQVLRWDEGAIRVEVVSNDYLDERYALSDDHEHALLEMGWERPAPADDESDQGGNFYVHAQPREADRVAVLVVRALREVYGCLHPSFLLGDLEEPSPVETVTSAAAVEPEEIAVMPVDDDHLRSLVDEALRVMLGDDLTHDEDGDVTVVEGRSLVWVRVVEDSPSIDLFAHVVLGVREHSRVPVELALLNRANELFKFVLVGDYVVMKVRLVAMPFAPAQLRGMLAVMLSVVDDLARELAVRLGGRRFRDVLREQPVAPEPPLALTALLEALHEGPMRPSSVAVLFSHDRSAIIAAIVALRRDSLATDDHDQELVLSHLRRALRFLSDGEARVRRGALDKRSPLRRSQQLSLLDVEETLDSGEWEQEVS
ncbi:hypothetical protein NPS01_13080 [Nocardioides psychrotolerans]|uniref:Uncharacterized protein n=1 Tax=Nocardioides psychrotolerans TaxID=1005945 RepID=A0A1I3HDS5_9ACTN|nr:hypothetical protein [Nocardioides psychrotolerans]GEP37645.1 hypothetical protein NPS01_13080 [Nocardioides psychrotolerans]SFI33791.1 hypothetical protein SAMN05216561_107138 [Nocardioides psychrotolerans]